MTALFSLIWSFICLLFCFSLPITRKKVILNLRFSVSTYITTTTTTTKNRLWKVVREDHTAKFKWLELEFQTNRQKSSDKWPDDDDDDGGKDSEKWVPDLSPTESAGKSSSKRRRGSKKLSRKVTKLSTTTFFSSLPSAGHWKKVMILPALESSWTP